MRLTRVLATRLFGIFDHEIPLNLDERITIIHGPNGFGKTIVLRLLAALMSGNYASLRGVSFEEFALEFDTGLRVKVLRQEGSEEDVAQLNVEFRLTEVEEPFSFSVPDESQRGIGYNRTGLHFDIKPLPMWLKFSEKSHGSAWTVQAVPDWFKGTDTEPPRVHFVHTRRLGFEPGLLVRPMVEEHSQSLATRIQQTLAEYAARSQELDRTFPTRLFNQTTSEPLTAEELRKRLSDLEHKRSTLMRLGFLEPEQGLAPASLQAIEGKRDVLSVYVTDMETKLALFDELAAKLQLFTRIINERFLFKRLEIDREKGFVFTSETGANLEPSALSSGEQHELVLFYELLFILQKNALVLIDEPEISLHVGWQEKFLEDLGEVVGLSELDVVLATHSPEIIGEHWNLTVELKAPPELHRR